MRLVLLWLFIVGLMAALTVANPTHFISVDSQYYLSMAGRLVGLDGAQYGHRATGWEVDFPVGYPLLIGCFARLTGLSLLAASKVINGLFVGLFLLLWQRRVAMGRLAKDAAVWMGSVWLLGGYLRIITYTWSECAFLVVLIEWYWVVQALVFVADTPRKIAYQPILRLLLLTMLLFTLRYAGSFFVVAYALMALLTYRRASTTLVQQRVGPDVLVIVLSSAYILATFYVNSLLTPYPLGTERFYETGETTLDKLAVIGWAFINEILLIRDNVPGEPVALVWIGLVIQLALFVWGWRIIRPQRHTIIPPSEAEKRLFFTWLWASATYLIILCTMRWFSPFSGPNARMMSVITLPLLMGLAMWVSRWPSLTLRRQVAQWWVLLLLASWLQLLPQADLVGKLGKLWLRQ